MALCGTLIVSMFYLLCWRTRSYSNCLESDNLSVLLVAPAYVLLLVIYAALEIDVVSSGIRGPADPANCDRLGGYYLSASFSIYTRCLVGRLARLPQ